MDVKEKKKKILAYMTKGLKHLDPTGGNIKRYKQMIEPMTDADFTRFMINMKEGRFQFHIIAPNMSERCSNDGILKAGNDLGIEMFAHVRFNDAATGLTFVTDKKYPILSLPVRRQQQFLDKKLSVPDSDTTIDGMTGQVRGADASGSVTAPEEQSLAAKNLHATLNELINIRGGNIPAYGEFARQLEETGSASMGNIQTHSVSRTAKVTEMFFASMMIDSNLTEG